MVIGVDGDVFPQRHVVGDAVVRQQVSAFFIFKDHQRQLAGGADVRLDLGAAGRAGWLGALQHGPLDLRSALRLDVGRHGAMGLGALSLRSVGVRGRLLGVGARPGRRGTLLARRIGVGGDLASSRSLEVV